MENRSENIWKDLLEQVRLLHEALKTCHSPIQITPELQEDIQKLRRATGELKEDVEDLFKGMDVDITALQKEVLESDDVRVSDKQMIIQAMDLQKESEVFKAAMKSKKKSSKSSSRSKDKRDKRLVKERKKMFKAIGGDQQWIPM